MTTHWQEVERRAVEFARSLGFSDVTLTNSGADSGLDLVGSDVAGQVKAQRAPIGRIPVQNLRGAAHRYEHMLFFSQSGYTATAIDFGNEARVALFVFDEDLNVMPQNIWASALVERERRVTEQAEAEAQRARAQAHAPTESAWPSPDQSNSGTVTPWKRILLPSKPITVGKILWRVLVWMFYVWLVLVGLAFMLLLMLLLSPMWYLQGLEAMRRSDGSAPSRRGAVVACAAAVIMIIWGVAMGAPPEDVGPTAGHNIILSTIAVAAAVIFIVIGYLAVRAGKMSRVRLIKILNDSKGSELT